MSLNGGNGSDLGGGGGSGGRLEINFLSSFMRSSYPDQSYDWTGNLQLSGGKGGKRLSLQGQDGQNGTVMSPKCMGGYSGPFCHACPIGTYKLTYSYGVCVPCEGKPANSHYTSKAIATANCPYECDAGRDPFSANPYCEDAFSVQIQRLGGTRNYLFFVGGFLALLMVIWISLVI